MTSTTPHAATDVLNLVGPGTNIVVPIGFGEPPTLIDTLEAHAAQLDHVRIHQMDPFIERRYIRGEFGDHLRHVSYYLGPGSRQPYWDGHVELVPNHFSEMPMLLRRTVRPGLVLAAASGPDQHGYFSLGTNADYVSHFIGRVPIFLEATAAMPRTHGHNTIHHSQVVGWCESDSPLVEVPRPESSACLLYTSPSPRDS